MPSKYQQVCGAAAMPLELSHVLQTSHTHRVKAGANEKYHILAAMTSIVNTCVGQLSVGFVCFLLEF